MLTRWFTGIVAGGLLFQCAPSVAAECPLDHLVIGCNRDGIRGTVDDQRLFVDCSQKYRHSGDPEYGQWYYPLQESESVVYRYRTNEPGLDVFQDADSQASQTYDPNRALGGVPSVDYRIILECVGISDDLRVVHEGDPQFTIDGVGDSFNYSDMYQLRGEGHVHMSYQAVDDANLQWITFRLRDDSDDVDRYGPSEPFTVVFNTKPQAGDLCVDGLVDWFDLLKLSDHWLLPGSSRGNDYWERADTDRNGSVDAVDFSFLARNWRTPLVEESAADWECIETGFNYILMDIEFPEGQSQIGYAIGESLTYKGQGIIIKTMDGGDTWTRLTPEGIPGLEAMSFADLHTGYAGGWDGYIIKTTDGGATWDAVTGTDGMTVIADIEFGDPNHGVLFEGGNVHVTEDGGQTWTAGTGISRVCHEVTYANEHTLFAAGNAGYIFKSVDGGHTWTTVYEGVRQDLLLGIGFLDAKYGIAVGDYSTVLTTVDGGETWTRAQLAGDMLLKSVSILDAGVAYLCGTPEYVFKTTDGGATWSSDYDGNWERAFNRVRFTDDGTGFICGSGGIIMRKAGLKRAIDLR